MFDRYLPTIGIVGLVLLVAGYFFILVPNEAAREDALTFSNTMEWSPEYLAFANGTTTYPAALFANISLPPPPKNSSPEVARELATLMSFRALRTPKEKQDFIMEGASTTLWFGGHTFADYNDASKFPATALLLKDSFHDVEVIEMQQKKIFDRVRPSILDPALGTMTPIQGHPAYPSYRSTEMHWLAYVFGQLAPARQAEFIARADAIAKNCQIAGLQYPSDTAGGVLLAQQIFADMMTSPKFQKLLAAAKVEWAADGLTRPLASSTPAT